MTELRLVGREPHREPSERARRAMLGGRTVAEYRRSWAGKDALVEMVEDEIAAAYVWPDDLPPCPPWCRYVDLYDDGHDYIGPLNDTAVPTFVRFHISAVGDPHLSQREENSAGVVTLFSVMIAVGEDADLLNGDAARTYAALLLAAVAQLEEIAR